MAIPANKEDLQSAIQMNYDKLRKELLSVPHNLTVEKTLEGHAKGTQMSINDLVAYLIGWGKLVLKWIGKKDKNEPVDFPETDYKWNELGLLAQKFYSDYKDMNYLNLLEKLDQVVADILNVTNKKTNKELYEMPWYGKYTLGRMIQLNTASPYTNARGRIRKWKKDRERSKKSFTPPHT